MIIQIIQILLVSLGFHDNTPRQATLYRQPEYTILNLKNPMLVIILSIIAMIIFTLAIFLLMPGTESGMVYNGSLA